MIEAIYTVLTGASSAFYSELGAIAFGVLRAVASHLIV